MNPNAFFDVVRAHYGALSQSQVEGFEALLKAGARLPLDSMAYVLATSYWETAHTMQPVREGYWLKNAEAWRKTHLRYWPYYGRGYVQLTWKANYQKATDYFCNKLGIAVDFVKNPDLALRPDYAAVIAIVGMTEGWFTGKDLDDYLDHVDESDVADMAEFAQARRIINGVDKAQQIAAVALVMEAALKAAAWK